ncbi:MAG: MFS transporter [Sphaerochaetaceae bacterium]
MKSIRVYSYRWVVLSALMIVLMVSEMQWLIFAPISRAATDFYQLQIPSDSIISPDILTLIHLISFLIFSVPASFLINKLGLKWSLRTAAILIAVFSLIKGFTAADFNYVVFSQIGLSLGYVIILNSVTTVTNRWFPFKERGFAAGLVSFSQYLGLLLIMIIAPRIVTIDPADPGYGDGLPRLLMMLGIITSVSALAVLFFFKEKPPTPPTRKPVKIEKFYDSLVLLLTKKHMGGFMIIFGLAWGLFNVFIAKIDSITAFVKIENSNGILGVLLLVGGLFGSIVIPFLSDYYRKRKFFFAISILGIFIGVVLFAFAPTLLRVGMPFFIIYIIVTVLGFFFQGTMPLGYQYAFELSYPVQEASSQGALLLNGHLVGALILIFMNIEGGKHLEGVLIASVALLFAALIGIAFVKESPIIVTEEERLKEASGKEWVHQR